MRRVAASTAPGPATRQPAERPAGRSRPAHQPRPTEPPRRATQFRPPARLTRAVALTAALALGAAPLLTGCGGHHDSDAKGKGSHATAHATTTPGSDALAAVALTTGDVSGIPGLSGYVSVAPKQGDDLSASGTSEALPESCQPLAGLLDGIPPGKPTATTSRNIVARKNGLKAASFEIDLASYPGGAAHTTFGKLSGSLKACGKFAEQDSQGTEQVTAAQDSAAAKSGDESVDLRLTATTGDFVYRVRIRVVRVGGTLAVIASHPALTIKKTGPSAGQPKPIPAQLAARQITKLSS
jgi:hypothetical protein